LQYELKSLEDIATPALVYYKGLIKENIDLAIRAAGDVSRLRPHIKSHKTVEIPRMQLEAGITKFKTATIAETEMLAANGFKDIVLAYPLVGANIARFAKLVKAYPDSRLSALTDCPDMVAQISRSAESQGVTIRLLVDIDAGMHRTGISFDQTAALYRQIAASKNLQAVGLHVYDGHNHFDKIPAVRENNAKQYYAAAMKIKNELEKERFAVDMLIMGGTPPFPFYAKLPDVELSPGACFLNDYGYGNKFEDIPFRFAAVLLTRVISAPAGFLTTDLGYKAVASDPAADNRARLVRPKGGELQFINFKFQGQNEEHWMLEADIDARPGDVLYAIPTHICPTSALYEEILVADDTGNITERWQVRSRKRKINI
jgi:D-serine deaminase-like pyridoxal phosphate-dependent protein